MVVQIRRKCEDRYFVCLSERLEQPNCTPHLKLAQSLQVAILLKHISISIVKRYLYRTVLCSCKRGRLPKNRGGPFARPHNQISVITRPRQSSQSGGYLLPWYGRFYIPPRVPSASATDESVVSASALPLLPPTGHQHRLFPHTRPRPWTPTAVPDRAERLRVTGRAAVAQRQSWRGVPRRCQRVSLPAGRCGRVGAGGRATTAGGGRRPAVGGGAREGRGGARSPAPHSSLSPGVEPRQGNQRLQCAVCLAWRRGEYFTQYVNTQSGDRTPTRERLAHGDQSGSGSHSLAPHAVRRMRCRQPCRLDSGRTESALQLRPSGGEAEDKRNLGRCHRGSRGVGCESGTCSQRRPCPLCFLIPRPTTSARERGRRVLPQTMRNGRARRLVAPRVASRDTGSRAGILCPITVR